MYRFKDGNTLVNISSSILKHYKVAPLHRTFAPLDAVLEANKHKRIVLFLFDALGKKILEKHSKEAEFILAHQFQTISSVFPPTTTAATTALLSSLYPSESGYLGWWSFLNGVLATTFSSVIFQSEETVNPPLKEVLAYKSIFDWINEKSEREIAIGIQSFTLADASIGGLIREVEKELPNREFIYAYLTEPDHTMHDLGTEDSEVKRIIGDINNNLMTLVLSHPEVLFLSLADHGMMDTVVTPIYSDLFDLCESHSFSMETRAATFFVKPENRSKFLELAKKYFADDFEIYTKEEVIALEILGPNENQHPLFTTLLGDYLIVAIGDKCIRAEEFYLKGNHAGGSEEESLISLCVYNND